MTTRPLCALAALLIATGASLVLALLVAVTPAAAFQTREPQASFGSDGSAASEFAFPSQVAIDASNGTTYVGDLAAGTIEKFDAAHQPEPFTGTSPQISEGKLTGFTASIAAQLAVDPTSHVLYVAGSGAGVAAYRPDGEPAEFTAGPDAGTNALAGSEVCGVAVDPNGDIYVSEFSNAVQIFEADGEPLTTIPLSGACNLAVDSHGKVYFDQPGGPLQAVVANEFPPTSATSWSAPATVDPNATTTVAFDPAGDDVLADEGERVVEYDPAAHRLGAFGAGAPNLAGSSGLAVGAGKAYLTDDEGSSRQVEIFGAPSQLPPSIDAASAGDLTASSAFLTASIDPGGLPAGYRFEYGTTTAYGTTVPVPDAQLGEGFGDVAVKQQISSLTAGVTYHWRVVAIGAAGTNTGVDHTFVYDISGERLPDGRAYEMVTPPQKNAALIGMVFLGLKPIVSDDGTRVLMTSIQCFADAESCIGNRQHVGVEYLFSRNSAGWETTALAPPAARFPVSSTWLASAQSGMVLISAPTAPGLEDDFYVRRPNGEFDHLGPATPPALGPVGLAPFGAGAMTATGDFSRFVFQADAPWVSEEARGELYELSASAGASAPIAVAVSGGPGSTSLISQCGSTFAGSGSSLVPGSMSADGETIFFTAAACEASENLGVEVPANTVYARRGERETVTISERSPSLCLTASCQSSPPQNALFAGASNDGSKAFFLSNQELLDGAGEEGNLYEYDFDNPAGENLIDASPGAVGEPAAVQGVVALSPDGSHIYFVAQGKLTSAPNASGESAHSGADNLYVFAREEGNAGQVSFVTQLPEADLALWSSNDDAGSANVTPDGRYLLFESARALTPDDTRTDGATQIFRYDAKTGALLRISVGDRGFNDNGNAESGDAHIVPGSEGGPHNHAGEARSDPTMSDDGAYVYFESPIALTPAALGDVQIGANGNRPVYAQNVYEWHEGRVHLISDGADTTELAVESAVKLIASDRSGHNVFFRTADALAPQDTDTQIDYYDAHVCSAEVPCVLPPSPPAPPCEAEACRAQPAPQPPEPSGGTATVSGGGNAHHSARPKKAKKSRTRRRCDKRGGTPPARCPKHSGKTSKAKGR